MEKNNKNIATDKPVKIRRENYCKYNAVKKNLLIDLQMKRPAKDSAKELGISLQTFYKYQCVASLEHGKVFETTDERLFLDKQMLHASEKQMQINSEKQDQCIEQNINNKQKDCSKPIIKSSKI